MKLYKNLKFYFQKAHKINQRTDSFVTQNGNEHTKHSKFEDENTKCRKTQILGTIGIYEIYHLKQTTILLLP